MNININKKKRLKLEARVIMFDSMLLLLISLLLVFGLYYVKIVNGGVSVNGNATVLTTLEVGNTYPEIINMSIDGDSSDIDLAANTTRLVSCLGLLRDYNNESDMSHVWAELFNMTTGAGLGDFQDNNDHYYNYSCNITYQTGDLFNYPDDEYVAISNCTFNVWYYADSGNWNCTMYLNDSEDWNATRSVNKTINELLALEVPDILDYGVVNATSVSPEKLLNVSNAGNVMINLSLSGYAEYIGDANAMNCSEGSLKNISIEYEKYNVTATNNGPLTLGQADGVYKNLSEDVISNRLNLPSRLDDSANDVINTTYWRIYVPIGVGGNCSGNIVFGATRD